MPLLHTFCTWFSVRMGCVIVALISLAHSMVLLILILITIQFQNDISFQVRKLLDQYDFLFATLLVVFFQENIFLVMSVTLVLILIHVCGSFILIYASYKLERWPLWPFIIFDLVKLVLLTIISVISMIIIRKNASDFNIVIVCLTTWGFYLLIQYYLWLCPVSLWQCITSLEKNKPSEVKKVDFNHLIFNSYQSDFQLKPVLPNRNYFLYHYGNLPKLNI